jgi:hypothetical protein
MDIKKESINIIKKARVYVSSVFRKARNAEQESKQFVEQHQANSASFARINAAREAIRKK